MSELTCDSCGQAADDGVSVPDGEYWYCGHCEQLHRDYEKTVAVAIQQADEKARWIARHHKATVQISQLRQAIRDLLLCIQVPADAPAYAAAVKLLNDTEAT